MSKKTSFVITCFNQAAYIGEAIESCLSQVAGDIEVVVVDDGSTDRSKTVIDSFVHDSRVKAIYQDNQGPSSAFNAGASACTGDYVAWLGGDDVSLPHRTCRQIEILEKSGADVLFCIPDIIDGEGLHLDRDNFPVFSKEYSRDNLLSILLTEGNFFCAPSAFMRRNVFERVGFLRHGFIQLQDYEYWVRCLLQGLILHRDNHPVVKYRRHASNLSSPIGAFASACEFALIVEEALASQVAASAIRRSSTHVLLPTTSQEAALTDLDKVLFMLSSEFPQVRIRGAQMAITLAETDDFRRQLALASINYPSFVTFSLAGQ